MIIIALLERKGLCVVKFITIVLDPINFLLVFLVICIFFISRDYRLRTAPLLPKEYSGLTIS